jgi:hypothetical protein
MNKPVSNLAGKSDDQPLVFRYRSVNIKNINSIINDYIWFSPFNSQNDPFDGTTEYEWDKKNNDLIWDEVKKYSFLKEIDHKILEDALNNTNPLFSDRNPVIISCFTRKYNDLLMWSHYANGHRGICQIFIANKIDGRLLLEINPNSIIKYSEKLIIKDRYLPLFPVIYRNKKQEPLLSSRVNTIEGIKQRVTSTFEKSKMWEYEAEYRALVFDNSLESENKLYYPSTVLFGLIIGCEMDKETKKLIEIICKYKELHLFIAKKVFGKYELEIEMLF